MARLQWARVAALSANTMSKRVAIADALIVRSWDVLSIRLVTAWNTLH